jgi:hypothetical protein
MSLEMEHRLLCLTFNFSRAAMIQMLLGRKQSRLSRHDINRCAPKCGQVGQRGALGVSGDGS